MLADRKSVRGLSVVATGLALLVFTGCLGDTEEAALARANDTNLKKLSNMYIRYQADHGFKGPSSEKQLRDYIEQDVPDFIKERIGLTSTDDIFISSRDNEPFKIRFAIMGTGKGCTEPAIFEQTGVNGKRLVGFLNMVQREVDDEQYEKMWSGEIKAPPEI